MSYSKLPAWLSICLILAVLVSGPIPNAYSAGAPAAPSDVKTQDTTGTEVSIYLPAIFKNYPLTNAFGVTMETVGETYGLTPLANAGTTWSRRAILWSAIEPSEGQRNWSAFPEQELIDAANRNLRVIVVVESTPTWALKSGFKCGAVAQSRYPALGNFLKDLVTRYSAPPYNVRYWELWNEPDAPNTLGCWGDPNDYQYFGGAYYGSMLRSAYTAIKSADPGAQVLVGGLLLACDPVNPPTGKDCTGSRFLNGILAAGGGPFFDGISFHAYDYYDASTELYSNSDWRSYASTTGPVSIAKARYIKSVLTQYGQSKKYLINTETALFYGPNLPTPLCVDTAPADIEWTKAYYLVQSYAVAVAEGFVGNVWYSALGVRCSGLLNPDLTPKPAFNAYNFTRSKLEEATFSRNVEYLGLMGYEYKLPDRRLWIIWSKDSSFHTISLTSLPAAITSLDQNGNPVVEAVSTSLTVGVAPRFIEFVP